METVTNTFQDIGKCVKEITAGEDGLLRFAAADTFAEGTILGRLVTTAITYAGVIVGSGVKTIALTARAGRSLKPGAYVLTAGSLTSGVGPAALVDPDGISEAVTLAVSGAHQFPNLGVTMTITAGGTELVTGDTVTHTVVAATSAVYAPWALDGSNGLQEASSVLHYEAVATEEEDQSFKAMTAGLVNRSRLVVDGGGSVPLSAITQLHKNGIMAPATTDLSATEGTEY
jgi:hypothetical protein